MLKFKSGTSFDAILLTFVKCISTLLGLLTVRIISAHFSFTDYASYNQAILVAGSIAAIVILGFTDATNYYFNKFYDQKTLQAQYLSTIITFQLFLGIIVFVLLILFKTSLSDLMRNSELSTLIKWIALTPLLNNIIAIQQILFVSLGKSKIIALRNLILSIIKLITVLISVYLTNSIETILAVMLFIDIIQMLYFSITLSKYGVQVSLNFFSFRTLKSILSYSIPLALFILTNYLMRETDKFIVSYLSNPETFAIYANASRILPFAIIVDSFTTVLLPFITRYLHEKQYEKLISTYKNYLNFSFIVIWILISGAIFSAQDLIELLYSNKYSSGLPIFIIYLLVSLVKFANFSFIFSCAGQTRVILRVSIISLILNIILSLLMYYFWGPIGCAFATLIVSIWVLIYYLVKTKRILNISAFKLFDLKIIFRIALQSLCLYLVVYVVRVFSTDLSYLSRLIITYGPYVIIMFLLNKKQIKEYILNLNIK